MLTKEQATAIKSAVMVCGGDAVGLLRPETLPMLYEAIDLVTEGAVDPVKATAEKIIEAVKDAAASINGTVDRYRPRCEILLNLADKLAATDWSKE